MKTRAIIPSAALAKIRSREGVCKSRCLLIETWEAGYPSLIAVDGVNAVRNTNGYTVLADSFLDPLPLPQTTVEYLTETDWGYWV